MMTSETGVSGSDGVEETSPDMLKNTPSNIQRLAHEIEQCEGRKKYLAQTGSPSDGGDVRWYFCKVPLGVNELSASVPRAEIVGKGDYFRFGMRDSLAIEASFLQREDDLLSSWWKEYAECSEGPKGQPSSGSKLHLPMSSQDQKLWQLFTDEEERVGVPVKGGLYEVDLVKRHCFPVYWNGENRRVLRGHWFARKGGLDWLPLREDVSEQLEYAYRSKVWHRRTFQSSGLFAARVDLQGSITGLHALFTGEDDAWEAWLSVESSGFSGVVGFAKNSIKLRRGYAPPQSQNPTQDELRQQKEEEMDDYCSQVPVRHVVFMVHGIGQRLEKSNLVDDVRDFRLVTATLEERHLTSYQRGMQRILYIPCQWRKGLTLSGELAIDKITLDGVRGLRRTLSATVHDVLYYMSPIYCQEIIDSVCNQLNRLYLKFLKRNPGYNGKVSLYGHSLGSVLSYDILCHQETLYSPFPMEWMYKEHKRTEPSSSGESNLSSIPKSFPNQGNENSENIGVGGVVTHADNPDLVFEHIGVGDIVTHADNTDLVGKHIGVGDIVTHADNPDLVEEHMESYQVGPPTPSESDESMIIDTGCQQTNDALLDENRDEVSGNSSDVDVSNGDFISGTSSQETGIPCDKDGQDTTDDDKDEIIKSLKEEIDMLKEQIKGSEAEYANRVSLNSTKQGDQPDPTIIQTGLEDSFKSYTPKIRYTKLLFKVDTFFAAGSPLGVFLSMRNVRIGIGKGKEYWNEENINEEMPACRQMFNIFHPCDPVAYRVEPLVCKEFIHKRPLIIPYHRGGKRLYVGFQELREGVAVRSQAFKDQLTSVRVKVLTICESKSSDDQSEESKNTEEEVERSYGTYMMERLSGSLDGRVDYILQDKTFRHPYVSVLSAHTNYWRDPDTALFILKHLYRDIPEEPISFSDEGSHSVERWSDPREIDEEELPLTFADTISIKNFAFRAKREIKGR